MPYFASDMLDTQVCEYQILATICHQGPSATSGHYTTTLHYRNQAWLCDDNVKPRLACDIHTAPAIFLPPGISSALPTPGRHWAHPDDAGVDWGSVGAPSV